jgi:hypothetical protein
MAHFITYTTQSTINDILFHSEIVPTNNPLTWITQKNAGQDKIKYALIYWQNIITIGKWTSLMFFPRQSTVIYVTQSGVDNLLISMETITKKHPITWLLEKNGNSLNVSYALINYL